MASASDKPPIILAGISKENELNLKRLVDLALNSSPKVGIVNFNVLKTFLLELLKALNLQNYEPKFGDDLEAKSLVENAIEFEKNSDTVLDAKIDSSKSGEDGANGANKSLVPKQNISFLTTDLKPISLERFHNLEDKYARMEQQLAALNSLPSNQHIIDKAKELKSSGAKAGPILEVWQYTQMSKRLESNEEGITKLTSLLQDLIGDMGDLKNDQVKNSADIQRLNDSYKNLSDRLNAFEKFKSSLVFLFLFCLFFFFWENLKLKKLKTKEEHFLRKKKKIFSFVFWAHKD